MEQNDNVQRSDTDMQRIELSQQAKEEHVPATPVAMVLKRLGLAPVSRHDEVPETQLVHDLGSPEWSVRASAVRLLGEREASMELIVNALRDEHAEVRMAAIQALEKRGEHMPVEALLSVLRDPEWSVRALAALTLRQGAENVPVAPLLDALSDEDETVRAAAARTLGKMEERVPLQALEYALHDTAWRVREAVVLTLGELGKSVPVVEWLLSATKDSDASVREAAALVLRQTYPEVLATSTSSNGVFAVQQTAVSPLEHVGSLREDEVPQPQMHVPQVVHETEQSIHTRKSPLDYLSGVLHAVTHLFVMDGQGRQAGEHQRTTRIVRHQQPSVGVRQRLPRRAVMVALTVVLVVGNGIAWSLLIHSLQQRQTGQTTIGNSPRGLPFYGPGYSVLDVQGNLYVLDADLADTHARVLELSPLGRVLAEWNPFKANAPPSGIAIDGQGNIYVSVQSENALYKLSPASNIPTKWSIVGQAPGGLAVDKDGNVYVALYYDSTIQKYSSVGKLLATWGARGKAPGQFKNPAGVVVDGQGNIYVVDNGNGRIQKLSPTGKPLLAWGTLGNGPGQFVNPSAIALDKQGDIYVEDGSTGLAQKFSATGKLLAAWGAGGTNAVQFGVPRGVVVDGQGDIYVSCVDSDGVMFTHERIVVLSPAGKVLAVWK